MIQHVGSDIQSSDQQVQTPANGVAWKKLHLQASVVAITLRSEMPNPNRSANAATTFFHNRVAAIMAHLPRYYFRGTSRLAADTGVSKATLSRMMRGQNIPLYNTVYRVVKCLECRLGFELPFDEVVALNGRYRTKYVCTLCRCSGCIPDSAREVDESYKLGLDKSHSGKWTGDNAEFSITYTNESLDPGTE